MNKKVKDRLTKIAVFTTVVAIVTGSGFAIKKNNDYNRAVTDTLVEDALEIFGKNNGIYEYYAEETSVDNTFVNNYSNSEDFLKDISRLENWLFISETLHNDGLDNYPVDLKEIDAETDDLDLDKFFTDYEDYLYLQQNTDKKDLSELSDDSIKYYKACKKMQKYAELANIKLATEGYRIASNLGITTAKIIVANEKHIDPVKVIIDNEIANSKETISTITYTNDDGNKVRIDSGDLNPLIQRIYGCQIRIKENENLTYDDFKQYNKTRNDIIVSLLDEEKITIAKNFHFNEKNEIESSKSDRETKKEYYELVKK